MLFSIFWNDTVCPTPFLVVPSESSLPLRSLKMTSWSFHWWLAWFTSESSPSPLL